MHAIFFGENVLSEVKEAHFSMPESLLWYSTTVNKSVVGLRQVKVGFDNMFGIELAAVFIAISNLVYVTYV